MAFRASRVLLKKRPPMPGVLHEAQLAVARDPERVLRAAGLVFQPQVCMPSALQQTIKEVVRAGVATSNQVKAETRRLAEALHAHSSGWPQPEPEDLADISKEPPITRERDVGRIPDRQVASLLRGWVKGTSSAVDYTEAAAMAYVAARMPSCFAAVERVLTEVSKRLPDFKPSSLLDFGSGPGTAIWAAQDVWGSSVTSAAAVEPSGDMAELRRQLQQGLESRGFPEVMVQHYRNLDEASQKLRRPERQFDLVIAAYSLNELPPAEQTAAIRRLWSHTRDVMVIVETGNPKGFESVAEARKEVLSLERRRLRKAAKDGSSRQAGRQQQQQQQALKQAGNDESVRLSLDDEEEEEGQRHGRDGEMEPHERHNSDASAAPAAHAAHADAAAASSSFPTASSAPDALKEGAFVVAPCAHDGLCPMRGTPNWCHFVQRLQRSDVQRIAKRSAGETIGQYEDEKFSYLVMRRGQRPQVESLISIIRDLKAERKAKEEEERREKEAQRKAKIAARWGPPVRLVPLSAADASEDDDEDELDDFSEVDSDEEGSDGLTSGERNFGSKQERGIASVSPGWGRLVREPRRRGQHVILDVCCSIDEKGDAGELQRHLLTKRAGAIEYRFARKVRWGDLWPAMED